MIKADTLKLAVGTPVYCTVHAVRGWYRVTAIRPRDGYIRISGFNTWNPPHNFRLDEPVRDTFWDRLGADNSSPKPNNA